MISEVLCFVINLKFACATKLGSSFHEKNRFDEPEKVSIWKASARALYIKSEFVKDIHAGYQTQRCIECCKQLSYCLVGQSDVVLELNGSCEPGFMKTLVISIVVATSYYMQDSR